MSNPDTDKFVETIYNYAAELVRNGATQTEVANKLMEQGLDRESATAVASNLQRAKSTAEQSAGRRNMLVGGLWCVGGLAVTIASYAAAANHGGGGSYVIAWGAVIFGEVQFFRGVSQSMGK